MSWGNKTSGKMHVSKPWHHLLPLVIPLGFLLLGGFGATLIQSGITLSSLDLSLFKRDTIFPEGYREILNAPGFRESVVFSLGVGFISAGFSTILALILAITLWRLPRLNQVLGLGFYLPLILPPVSVAYLGIFWLGPRGMAAGMLQVFGLNYSSPLFQGDGWGLILTYIYKETPFGLLMILPILRAIPRDMIHTALLLGARWPRILRTIVLPRLGPGILSVFLILFVYTFGAYDIPSIVGESRPSMISQLVYRLYFIRPWEERPLAAAAMVLVFLFSFTLVLVYGRLVRHIDETERTL